MRANPKELEILPQKFIKATKVIILLPPISMDSSLGMTNGICYMKTLLEAIETVSLSLSLRDSFFSTSSKFKAQSKANVNRIVIVTRDQN